MAGGEKSKQSRSGRLAGHPLSAGANVPLGVLSDTWEPNNASQPHATGCLVFLYYNLTIIILLNGSTILH